MTANVTNWLEVGCEGSVSMGGECFSLIDLRQRFLVLLIRAAMRWGDGEDIYTAEYT
jgi:hypothetical protein